MIVYFADRSMNILGQASDRLEQGYRIANDACTSDVEHGSETLSFDLYFDQVKRKEVESLSTTGNYILKYSGKKDKYKLYTIIDTELNINERVINVYAEDGGLDLLNETAGPYDSENDYPISNHVKKYLKDTGFVIGINEIGEKTKKRIVFEDNETITARLLKIAAIFEAELTYSYAVNGLRVTKKCVDIYKKLGTETAIELRVNREIENIIVKKSIANMCSGITPIGAAPDGIPGYISDTSGTKTKYAWIAYSDSGNGSEGFEGEPGDHAFIGVRLNNESFIASETPSKYAWARVKYDKVIIIPSDVTDGFQEYDSDGQLTDRYTWIRFAEDENGSGITTVSSNATQYIGIATGKDDTEPATDDYSWDLYFGYGTKTLYLKATTNPLGWQLADGRYCHWAFGSMNSSGTVSNINYFNGNSRPDPTGRNAAGFVCSYTKTHPSAISGYIWGELHTKTKYYSDRGGAYAEMDFHNCGIKTGENSGVPVYTWIKFAKDEELSEISDSPKSMRHIGFAYNKTSVIPSTNKNDYKWYKINSTDKIVLDGYVYDKDGIYIKNGTLYSDRAIAKWTRYKIAEEGDRQTTREAGAIVRIISYDEGNPDDLFKKALADLKKYSQPEVNYEVSTHYIPDDISLGDRINIVDDAGELYVSARVLKIERSEAENTSKITLGDFLAKDSGFGTNAKNESSSFVEWAKANPVTYTWTVYCDDPEAEVSETKPTLAEAIGISLNPEEKKYIGVATNQSIRTPDISDAAIMSNLFNWSKIQGEDGQSGTPGETPIILTIRSQNAVFHNTNIINTNTLTAIPHYGKTILTYANLISMGYTVQWYVWDESNEQWNEYNDQSHNDKLVVYGRNTGKYKAEIQKITGGS